MKITSFSRKRKTAHNIIRVTRWKEIMAVELYELLIKIEKKTGGNLRFATELWSCTSSVQQVCEDGYVNLM